MADLSSQFHSMGISGAPVWASNAIVWGTNVWLGAPYRDCIENPKRTTLGLPWHCLWGSSSPSRCSKEQVLNSQWQRMVISSTVIWASHSTAFLARACRSGHPMTHHFRLGARTRAFTDTIFWVSTHTSGLLMALHFEPKHTDLVVPWYCSLCLKQRYEHRIA